jgi:hypothetical protein
MTIPRHPPVSKMPYGKVFSIVVYLIKRLLLIKLLGWTNYDLLWKGPFAYRLYYFMAALSFLALLFHPFPSLIQHPYLFLLPWSADAIGALIHYIGDRSGSEAFIGHHRNPMLIASSSFLERSAESFMGAALSIVILNRFLSTSPLYPFLVSHAILIGFSNETHAWAHRRQNNLFITFLQNLGVILSSTRHEKHHRGYRSDFGTLTGLSNRWMNYLLTY